MIALTPAARLAGVRLDMRAGAAIAPQVELLPRSPQAEADAQGAALALLQYARGRAGRRGHRAAGRGRLQFFRGPRALARRVATLRALDLRVSLGMAPTAAGAAAGAAPRTARLPAGADPAHARSQARRAAAGPAAPARRAWTGWDIGCARWATCALPRAGLQRRSAPELLAALDAAYGLAPEPQRWIEPPARFARRIELMEYLEHTDAVLAVARRLAEQLGGWLAASQLAVRKITLSLEHERGRRARAHRAGTGAVATSLAAGADPRPAAREAGPHDADRPGHRRGPVGAETVAQPPPAPRCFPNPAAPPRTTRLLDLLSARLGRERVRRARPQADHRPEAANAWGDALQRPPAPSRCRRCWTVPSGCWIRRSRCAPATARSIGARRCG